MNRDFLALVAFGLERILYMSSLGTEDTANGLAHLILSFCNLPFNAVRLDV